MYNNIWRRLRDNFIILGEQFVSELQHIYKQLDRYISAYFDKHRVRPESIQLVKSAYDRVAKDCRSLGRKNVEYKEVKIVSR